MTGVAAHRLARQQARAHPERVGARRAPAAAPRPARRDRGHPDQGRQAARRAAGQDRRQGPVHQGARDGDARRPHRPRRALGQGHADGRSPTASRIVAFTAREDVRDVFVGRRRRAAPRTPRRASPRGAVVGTSSLRRRSQLLALRPDLELVDIRGNVQTRLRKLEEQGMAGTILAAAGLARLGQPELAVVRLLLRADAAGRRAGLAGHRGARRRRPRRARSSRR